jgi:iron complex outermembrane receptor protein
MAIACLSLVAVTTAKDAEAAMRRQTNIAAQGLAPALRTLAKERDVQLVYRTELVGDHQTSGAAGDLTFEEALTQLLNGTGLTYRYLENNAVTIVSIPSGSSSASAQDSPPRVTGEGSGARGSQGSETSPTASNGREDGQRESLWDRFRLAQVDQGKNSNSSSNATQSHESSRQGSSEPTELEEILVTARRREEKLQTVPIAITVFTAADLAKQQISDQYHLGQTVPSLVVFDPGVRDSANFAIRGQSASFNTSAGVITYFDEVPSVVSAVGSYFDLENVQILKGPQGTLFGGTATGGAILFESAKPKDDFEGYAKATLGDYNWHEFEGAINIPLVADEVLLRIAGNVDRRDGYTKDVGLIPSVAPQVIFLDQGFYRSQAGREYDNRDDQHIRVSLLVRPTDKIDNLIVARYDHRNTNGPGSNIFAFNSGAFAPGQPLAALAPFAPILAAEIALQTALGPRAASYDAPQLVKDQIWQVIDKVTWDVTDYLTFKNIASYSEDQNTKTYDMDATPFPLLQTDETAPVTQAVITEEAQTEGRWFDAALRTTAGFYYEYDYQPKGLLEANGFVPQPNSFFTQAASLATLAQHQHAGYAQATYDLGKAAPILEGVKFTGGVRYTSVNASSSGTTLVSPYVPFGSLFLPPPVPQPVSQGLPNCFTGAKGCFSPIVYSTNSSSHLGWTIGLEDQTNATTLVYVRAGKAFKPGGDNANAIASQGTFGSEYLQDVEIGLKKDWAFAGMKARTNVALYRGDYSNIQRSLLGSSADGTPIGLTLNVGNGTIEGAEFEGTWFPGYGLEFDATYSSTQARYDTFATPQLEAALQGVGFPYTPKNKASVTGRYHLPLPDGIGDVSLSTTYSYLSRYDVGLTSITSTFPYLPSCGLLDAQINWNGVFGRSIDATAFSTNATDQACAVSEQDFYRQLGFVNRSYGEPRMWGIRLNYHFGGA